MHTLLPAVRNLENATKRQRSYGVTNVSQVSIPPCSSNLTAMPDDDFEAEPNWLELHTEETSGDEKGFWHVMDSYTRTLHWNRQIFDISIESEALTPTYSPDSGSESSQPPLFSSIPPPGMRYTAVREIVRKTPSPIGGGLSGTDPSYVAHEWTTQYIARKTEVRPERHTAVFGLIIPEAAAGKDNPRAMTYWPFHYPKARCYKYTWEALPDAENDEGTSGKYLLRFAIVPLGDEKTSETASRRFDVIRKHAKKAAAKQLIQVRKRAERFDTVRGVSTYVKRVIHDVLVPERLYRSHYNRLKVRYAYWVGIWAESEVTDPVKFVFEEMAIAAYLCALWEIERDKERRETLQTFVDAGCGNGFLVYLLRMEGHSGIGVDSQRRKIWDRYPKHVSDSLRHETMDPETFDCSGYDWIIGNHSDELTPWLPAMAARAQMSLDKRRTKKVIIEGVVHEMREARPKIFILPCCFFDFDGRKLAFGNKRRTVGVPHKDCDGKYEQYVNWVSRLCDAYGWHIVIENLRIPSTKYKCIIGTSIWHEDRTDPAVITELTKLLLLDARLSRG